MCHQLTYVLNKDEKRKCIIAFVVSIGTALFETLGVSVLLPFVQALLELDKVRNKWYISPIADKINSDTMLTVIIVILIVVVYLIKNIYITFATKYQIFVQNKIRKDMSTRMLQSYMKHPYSFFLNTNSSVVLRGITQDVDGVYSIVMCVLQVFTNIAVIVGIGILLLCTDVFITVSVFILALFCFIVITLGFRKTLSRLGRAQREMTIAQSQCAYQAIMGIKEILVMRRQNFFSKRYAQAYEDKAKADADKMLIDALPERIIETLFVTGIMAAICIRLNMKQDMTDFISSLAVFAVGAFRIMPAVSRIVAQINCIVFYKPTLESAYHNMCEVDNFEKTNHLFAEASDGEKLAFDKELCIENLTWQYRVDGEMVLKGLDMTIKKGQSVALIGNSGTGKTTLADMILGLLKPNAGKIMCDGTDVYSNLNSWGNLIGYVSQSIFLIDDTIKNNVAFGIAENEIDEGKIWRALDQAQMKEFVLELPEKLDTIAGERGVRFSGGQRQRIAIARALYTEPEILVLDEATSALDTETENAVMESIENLQGKKTLIIIAHRLSTIRKCDKVYEIKDGRAYLRDIEEVMKQEYENR